MDLYTEAVRIVLEAGKQLIERKGIENVMEKGITDYVTDVDVRVQKVICQKLLQLDPSIQFVGEEKDNQEIDWDKKLWILDPVDGTTNLMHDFHHSVISLAYAEKREIQFGVVYNPYSGEVFEARLGKGAFLNQQPIRVSGRQKIGQCLISMGTAPGHRECADETFKKMRKVYDKCQDIRRIGTAALELAYVACGRLDAFFEERLKIWDYAAGLLLVREAGGIAEASEQRVIASTPAVMDCFKEVVEGRDFL